MDTYTDHNSFPINLRVVRDNCGSNLLANFLAKQDGNVAARRTECAVRQRFCVLILGRIVTRVAITSTEVEGCILRLVIDAVDRVRTM